MGVTLYDDYTIQVGSYNNGHYDGKGITCLKDGVRKELRFKANIQWAIDAPEFFKDRNFAEHPDVPGNGGQELLDKVRLVIYKE